ncbi:hypothetical protein IID10_01615 [candidate division KSB1 bacterium]|nr:hypothetical protein [candidate division KSB1 bacterium]
MAWARYCQLEDILDTAADTDYPHADRPVDLDLYSAAVLTPVFSYQPRLVFQFDVEITIHFSLLGFHFHVGFYIVRKSYIHPAVKRDKRHRFVRSDVIKRHFDFAVSGVRNNGAGDIDSFN